MAEGGAAQSRGAAIRETFAVALIAGEGVDLSGLSGLAGDKGFALLTRDDVVGTAPDEGDAVIPALQQEWEDAKAKAEDPELPMPHKLFGCLLAAALAKPAAPAEGVPEDDDSPPSALFRIAGGPKSVRISLDVPKSVEEAREFVAGGALDAVLIVRKPAPAPADAAPDDGADSEEAPPAAEPPAVDPEVQAQGERAEALYAGLRALGREQRIGGHNPNADTFFDAIVAPSAAPSSEELIESVALALIGPVYHRTEYAAWLEGVPMVQLAPRESDLRHYDETLSKVPHTCLSVPVILNALLDQVALNEQDPAAENRDLRKVWSDNKRTMRPLEDAFALLAGTPEDPAVGANSNAEGGGALLPKADERNVRLTDPSALGNPAVKEAIAGARERELNLSLTVDVARLFPAATGGNGASSTAAPLGEDAVLRALPQQKLTPAQARHGLLLLELEQMLGVESGSDGQVKAQGARPMSDMSMHKMCFREELTAEALQQQLATAVLQDEPEVVTRYYSREDALLVALCSLVPKSRVLRSSWKNPMCAQLGFVQWLDARRELKAALPEAEEDPAQVAEAAPQEVTPGADNEGEEPAEGEEEKPKPKREYKMPLLPLPDKPARVFDVDAKRAALFDEQQVMVLSEGTRVIAGTAKAGAYVRWHTPSHNVSMCEQTSSGASGEGGAGKWSVSVTYEDGACLVLRQIGEDGQSARVCASMSCADGVHVTLDGGADGDGIVWRSVPHERGEGPRGALSWTAKTGEDAVAFSRTATPAPEGEEGGEAEEGEEGALKPQAPKPLPQGAPVDPKPKEAEATMVLPNTAGGGQVIRKADGTARVLLADGSVGWYGGESRGWEWTNAKGLRQGKVPQFPGVPQHREKINMASEGDARSGSMTRWRQDGIFETRNPGGGVEEICVRFADGSVSAAVPAKRTTCVVRERLGQVAVGPGERECKVQLEDGTVMSVSPEGLLRVTRRGDCAEMECEIASGVVRFYSAGRAAEESAPAATGGHEDLLSQQVRGAGPGSFFMDLSKGHMRTVDSCQHLYMVSDGIAQVVLAGEPVPSLSDAPAGPRDAAPDAAPLTVSIDGAERLEPLRVFVVRRNGTGYELLAEDAAKTAMVRARRAGEMVLEEAQGDAGIWTMVAPEQRGLIPPAEAERYGTPRTHARTHARMHARLDLIEGCREVGSI